MKWFKITILFFLSLCTIFVALVETKPGQRFLQKRLLQALEDFPLQIEIGQINNLFPNNIDLTNVRLSFDDTTIQIAHLRMRLALLPLFTREWAIEVLEGEGVQFQYFPDQLFSVKVHIEKKQGRPTQFSNLSISNEHLQIQGDLLLDEKKQFIQAHAKLQTEWIEIPLTASGTIEGYWAPHSFVGSLDAKGQFLQEPWTLITPFAITQAKGIEVGLFSIQSPLANGQGQLFWQNGRLSGHGNIQELNLNGLHVKETSFESNDSVLTVNMQEARWKQLNIDTATLSAANNGQNWLGILSLNGPSINGELRGYWRPSQLILEEAVGQYLSMPFQLETPSFIQWSEESLDIKPFVLRLGEDGTIHFSLELNSQQLHLTSNLNVGEHQLASLNLQLPIRSHRFDFDAPVSARLSFNGKIEELLDLFPLGMHRFGGDTTCNLSMKGTLHSPQLEGNCTIEHGFYENYLTGTELIDVDANIQSEGDHLYLTALTAQDRRKKGHCTATGNLYFSIANYLPFHAEIDFTRLTIVQIDLVEAEAEGHLILDGDIRSAVAKGHVEIIESEITIPDKIPRSYPDLPVVYKGIKHSATPRAPSTPYPLNLDVTVDAPEGIFIDGRGLQSEWHGQFGVKGTFATPSLQGKLELTNGEFSFASRRFKLIEGSLSLKGKPYEMPNINIAATTTEKGISITAHLVGPLNKPQITFHSSPPLPMSGILSYLLFGQDLSEVSGIQALQLAGTIATFAGEGPDILEMTRKSLGIDRLQIVMTPTGTEGEETLALQVGKIVFPGFLVLIKQGADDSSPNIAIEVDLTHGFTFEAESEQQPAQGKFSLQWNLNY